MVSQVVSGEWKEARYGEVVRSIQETGRPAAGTYWGGNSANTGQKIRDLCRAIVKSKEQTKEVKHAQDEQCSQDCVFMAD